MEQQEFGYINEDGYLRSKFLEPILVKYTDEETGDIKTRTVSIEEQLLEMGDIWKPVDRINEEMLVSDDPNYNISIVPYDNGDRISYRYEKVFNNGKLRLLKEELKDDDYKIIKCYEASLVGDPLPYDINALHVKRQKIRDEINMLEVQKASSL